MINDRGRSFLCVSSRSGSRIWFGGGPVPLSQTWKRLFPCDVRTIMINDRDRSFFSVSSRSGSSILVGGGQSQKSIEIQNAHPNEVWANY